MSKNKTIQQEQQSLADHAKQGMQNKANTMPTYHKDKHEPNRPSV